jgi:Tfp pilus assembly protein PilX
LRLTAPSSRTPAGRIVAREDGFTMIFALLTLLISGLLVTAAFTAARGDANLSSKFTLQTSAYYAAEAGVQRYQHELSSNPNYWIECKSIGTEGEPIAVPATTSESYFVKTLAAAGHSANR